MLDWFYTQHGEQQGPVSEQELRQLAASGQLQPTDLVWKQGLPDWMPVSTVLSGPGGITAPHSGDVTTPHSGRTHSSSQHTPWSQPLTQQPPRRNGMLVAVIGVAVLLIVGVAVYFFWMRNGNGEPNNGKGDLREFALRDGRFKTFSVQFQKAQWVKLSTTTRNQARFRFYIYAGNDRIAARESVNGQCRFDFVPTRTQDYRIRIQGREPGDIAKGKLSWKVHSLEELIDAAKKVPLDIDDVLRANDPIFLAKPIINLFNKEQPKHFKSHDVHLEANKTYTIDLESNWDNYLYVKNLAGYTLAQDDDDGVGQNARIRFQPPETSVYRVFVTTFAVGGGPYTLRISSP